MILDQYVRSIDPFLLGCSDADLLCLGAVATGGAAFPWRIGGTLLRRRKLYPTLGPWRICGRAKLGDAAVTTFPGFGHDADQAYEYAAATFFGNGMISEWSEPARIDFDAGGALVAARLPNAPKALTVEPVAGGKFALAWEYDAYGQGTIPSDFQVFEGASAGTINYAAPLTDSVTGLSAVRVVGKRRRYELTTAAFADGTVHVFAVRSRNSAGTSEKNTAASEAKTARTTAAVIGPLVAARLRRG